MWWEKKGDLCLRRSGKASGRRWYLNRGGINTSFPGGQAGDRVSDSGSGELEMSGQGGLRELGSGSQCWKAVKDELGEGVSRATAPFQEAEKKRESLAQIAEKAQARMSGPTPGICLPSCSGVGKNVARTSRRAATLPREIKDTHWPGLI